MQLVSCLSTGANNFGTSGIVQDSCLSINIFRILHVVCLITYMPACSLQVLELFKAADKYDVPGLVKECVQIFRKLTQSADVAPLLQVSWGCC